MSNSRHFAMAAVGAALGAITFATGFRVASVDLQDGSEPIADRPRSVERQVVAMVTEPSLTSVDPQRLFNSVLYYLRSQYVDSLDKEDDRKLSYGAIRGVLSKLDDPSTRFLEPDEVKSHRDAGDGRFSGLGAVLTTDFRVENGIKAHVLEVVSALPGSGAEKAGLRAGDVIDAVNGQWVLSHNLSDELEPLRKAVRNKKASQADLIRAAREASAKQENAILLSEAVKKLTRVSDAPVKLTIKRPGAPRLFEVTAPLGSVQVDPVDYRLVDDRWGYVHLRFMNARALSEFDTALKTLKPRMKGLILDMRDNAGGDEATALGLLSRFLPRGATVGFREARKGDKSKKTLKLATGTKFGMPMMLLTNAGTNNLSEMVVAALKETAGVRSVGATTHGDGYAHTPISYSDGSLLLLTTGKYYTPKGLSFHTRGIVPDVKAEGTGAYGDRSADVPLQKAIELLAKGVRS